MNKYLKEPNGKLLCPHTLITMGNWFKVDSTTYYMLDESAKEFRLKYNSPS